MPDRFIETDDGWVNLRYVRLIRRLKGGRAVAFTEYGERYEMFAPGDHLLELACAVVPARPDDYGVAIYVTPESGEPVDADLWVEQMPIVAWRIPASGDALPVFAEAPAGEVLLVLPRARGGFIAPDDQSFDTLEQAKAEALSRAVASYRCTKAATQGATPCQA
jgi:hypothetical protein